MLHAQVCALERLHTLTLVARPKTMPRRQGLPLRAYVPRSCVCTSVPTHLESRSISEDRAIVSLASPWRGPSPRRQVLPLRACVPRSGVCTSKPPHLYSRSTSEDRATAAGLAPASVCSTLRCVHVSAYTFVLVARPKTAPRRQGLPLRACAPRSGVCTS
jgi:hypothetical protein